MMTATLSQSPIAAEFSRTAMATRTTAQNDRDGIVQSAALEKVLENLDDKPPAPKDSADPASPNTEAEASLFSRLTFSWVSGMLRLGCTRTLRMEDLWALSPEDEAGPLCDRFERGWQASIAAGESPSVGRVLYRMYYARFWISAAMYVGVVACQFGCAALLTRFVQWVQRSASGLADASEGWAIAAGLLALQLGQSLFQSHTDFLMMRWGLQTRALLVAATFRRAMLLSVEARVDAGAETGRLVNLMASDSQRLLEFLTMLHRIWTAPFVLVGGIVYIYSYIGSAVFAAVALMACFAPVAAKLGLRQRALQREILTHTDERVARTNDVLNGIRVAKIYAWEDSLRQQLETVRKAEVHKLRAWAFFKALTAPTAVTIPTVSSVVAFLTYAAQGSDIEPAAAFTVVALFTVIRAPFTILPLGISLWAQVNVSLARFKRLFLLPTRSPSRASADDARGADPKVVADSFAIAAGSVFSWPHSAEVQKQIEAEMQNQKLVSTTEGRAKCVAKAEAVGEAETEANAEGKGKGKACKTGNAHESPQAPTLDFSLSMTRALSAQPPSLIAVVGPVGAGKSTLVSAVLGETLTGAGGARLLAPSVAYAAQTPFITNATLKQNILFGRPYDEVRYRRALHAAALLPDLRELPAGDATEIGERGINLSGGQKQRVSIARAVFSGAELVVLDDPLSAVDAHVARHIFTHCVQDAFKGATVLLVTHAVQFLTAVQHIVVLDGGKVVETGSYSELVAAGGLFSDLVTSAAMEPAPDSGPTPVHDGIDDAEKIAREESAQCREKADQDSNSVDCQSGVGAGQGGTAATRTPDSGAVVAVPKAAGLVQKEGMAGEGAVAWRVYAAYFLAGAKNSWFIFALLALSFFTAELGFICVDTWLAQWSTNSLNEDTGFYMRWYGIITAMYFVAQLIRSFSLAAFGVEASRRLHCALAENVLGSPMRFFDTTPIGRILNRFSRDLGDLDLMLPDRWQWLIMCTLRVVSILGVLTYATPLFAVFLVPLGFVYLRLQRYYRATSRELQRLESVSRSPIFAQFSEVLLGRPTIRAYRLENHNITESERRQRLNNRAYFAKHSAEIWLTQRLMFVGALIVFLCAACIVLLQTVLDRGINAGMAGACIAYALNIVINLNMSVRNSAEVEARMNCVERIVEFSELEQESSVVPVDNDGAAAQTAASDASWLKRGAIEFDALTIVYRPGLPPALRSFSLSVRAGERLGIVGRTGAGKSTLLLALLRLVPWEGGSVRIDGMDLRRVPLKLLRSTLAVIPQDPVIFTGSVRANLNYAAEGDAEESVSDDAAWSALRRSHLEKFVQSLPGTLDSAVEGWSLGQRQLLCLARALLREAGVLCIDEATAAVDAQTDELLQHTLTQEFDKSTVLTIAHRISTVMQSDRIAVVEKGQLHECASPQELLGDPNSAFAKLVEQSRSS